MELRIAGLEPESITDGEGLRYTVFTQGCPHGCIGCHNPESHDFDGGRLMDTREIFLAFRENPLLTGISFSGGEPFCQPLPLWELAQWVHDCRKDVTVYSGWTYEELLARPDPGVRKLLAQTDILVDGRYEASLRNLALRFRGSENQRVIDMAETRKQGKVVEYSR